MMPKIESLFVCSVILVSSSLFLVPTLAFSHLNLIPISFRLSTNTKSRSTPFQKMSNLGETAAATTSSEPQCSNVLFIECG